PRFFQTAVELRSPYYSASLALGVLDHVAGNYTAASVQFEKVLASTNGNWQGRAHLHLAALRLSEKNWTKAKEHFVKASRSVPDAHFEELDLKELYQNAPKASVALLSYAVFFLFEGFRDTAVSAYRESIRRMPTNVVALFLLSNALAGNAEYAEALNSLEKVAGLAP